MRRWPLLLAAALLLFGFLVPTGASAAGSDGSAKVSSTLKGIVDHDLGDKLYADVVPGHVPGTVYYLAKVNSVDAPTLLAMQRAGATVRHRFDLIGWVALSSPTAVVARIAALPQVARLEADKVLQLLTETATPVAAPTFNDQSKRGNHDVGADLAWAKGVTGTNVTVGVVDSGIDSTHPDLSDHIDSFVDCMGVIPSVLTGVDDIGACVAHPGFDDNGHGTHVSGIATGTGATNKDLPGMAPTARLAGAKVCNGAGSCLNSSVMAGILQVSTPKDQGGGGANVVNISLGGGPGYAAMIFNANQETDADPEAQLIDVLAEKYNVVFAIAAGNAGPTLQSVGSPSTSSQGISVGASVADFDLNHPREETLHGMNGNVDPAAAAAKVSAIATFSSRGPSGDRQIKPDFTAPGSYVVSTEALTGGEVHAGDAAVGNNYSTDPMYAVLSGTSMAAPSAAGSAALVIDGYRQAVGSAPKYYVVKAAMANTAHGTAFEGPITGLTSSIKSNRLGMDPNDLFPPRNTGDHPAVGVSGDGAGREFVPDAIRASTTGVVVYTPAAHDANGVLTTDAYQPGWGLDDLGPGQSATQSFVLWGAPKMTKGTSTVTFAVEAGPEATGVNTIPAKWFKLPTSATAARNAQKAFNATVTVPKGAAPGQYSSTIVATADLGGGVKEKVRIPVQLFVPMPSNTELTGKIWASDTTDYSIVGFENPLGQIYTDWTMMPVRVPKAGAGELALTLWDEANASTMDMFVFNGAGDEIQSTVTTDPLHAVPAGAALTPTTSDTPASAVLTVVDPSATPNYGEVHPGDVVWVVVSDTKPANPVTFETYHLVLTQG